MKRFKEGIIITISFFVAIVVFKTLFNGLKFEVDYLIDGLFMALGFSIGWFGYQFLYSKIKKNK